MRRSRAIITLTAAAILGAAAAACTTVNDRRVPMLPVYINLSGHGLWNTYGVAGFGIYRTFVRELGIPAGYSYTQTTYTGFGGVLLIGGMDPFTVDTQAPLAYDLACPVESRADVRVYIDDATLQAVCPICASHYDVTMAGGSPTEGPAKSLRYGLRRLTCQPQPSGGYIIRD